MKASQKLQNKFQDQLNQIGYGSLLEVDELTFDALLDKKPTTMTYSEAQSLHQAARQYANLRRKEERKAIVRCNPQLQSMNYLNIETVADGAIEGVIENEDGTMGGDVESGNETMPAVYRSKQVVVDAVESRGYTGWFGQRANNYVAKDSVASMFSPAAYLTELYREGKKLHVVGHPQSLDTRRPDLKNLTLSQGYQDTVVSTLALSNEILKNVIDDPNLDSSLANNVSSFALPYHAPFRTLESVLKLQNRSFEALAERLTPTGSANTRELFGNRLSPALAAELIAPLPTDAEQLKARLARHYGSATVEALSNIDTLCQKTGLSRDELYFYFGMVNINQSGSVLKSTKNHRPATPKEYGGRYLGVNTADYKDWNFSKSVNITYLENGCLKIKEFSIKHSSGPWNVQALSILPSSKEREIRFSAASRRSELDTNFELVIKVPGQDWVYALVKPAGGNWANMFFSASSPIHDSFNFSLIRANSGAYWMSDYEFLSDANKSTQLSAEFFIKLSQLIRYCQATGLSPVTLDRLIVLSSTDSANPTITAHTLQLTRRVLQYMVRYQLSEDDAVVLAGGDINAFSLDGELSQFDRLFNQPPLNGTRFTTDTVVGSLDFDPVKSEHAHSQSVLKRALGVDDAGLLSLVSIADPASQITPQWTRSLTNLSLLYRIGLLARVHGLAPQELQRLLQLSGKTAPLISQSRLEAFHDYQDVIYATQQWLGEQKLTVDMLSVMLNREYPTTLTPEIQQFLQTLYQAGKDVTVTNADGMSMEAINAARMAALAPHIAAGLDLADRDVALQLLTWMESHATGAQLELTSSLAYWQALASYSEFTPTTETTQAAQEAQAERANQLVQFTQALAQLALIIKTFKCSVPELAYLMKAPPALELATLRRISQLKALQQAVGAGAPELLTLLNSQRLDTETLARLLNQPMSEIASANQAIGACGAFNEQRAARAMDWLSEAQALGVSVSSLQALLNSSLTIFTDWQKLASAFQAGLADSLRAVLHQELDEALSAALCAEYLAYKVTDASLKNRDDVFQHLLIDNQVNSQVQTTRIAEAISTVQLYINRCQQGLEPDVIKDVQQGDFFKEWDQYNKRYSTWAGVSQLAYYPENYIDPALRYNQSNLQQQLLMEISQSQLSKESVESAYWNYLNNFEEVANLKVLSGYRDAADLNQGTSYFIGRSGVQPYRYFWRSLKNGAGDSDGYAASAWSAWEEIQTPIQAINDQVRPVVFNNRLYIAWMECKDGEDQSSIQQNGKKKEYSLKLSYRQLNGSWAPAMSFSLKINVDVEGFITSPAAHIYLSHDMKNNVILFVVYDSGRSYMPAVGSTLASNDQFTYGGILNAGMQFVSREAVEWRGLLGALSPTLNPSSFVNKVIAIHSAEYNGSFDVIQETAQLPPGINNVTASISNIQVANNTVPASISYQADATIETSGEAVAIPVVPIREVKNNIHIGGGSFDNVIFKLHDSRIEGDKVIHMITASAIPRAVGGGLVNLIVRKTVGGVDTDFLVSNPADLGFITHVPIEQTIRPDGLRERVEIRILENGGGVGQAYVLGHTAAVRTRNFTYSWGERDIALPSSGRTAANATYAIPIPLDGLYQNRSLTVKEEGRVVYEKKFTIKASKKTEGNASLAQQDQTQFINEDIDSQASYLQFGSPHRRIRLNTLFARELINRAQSGLDNILNWDTQCLSEPKLGKGGYIDIHFEQYNSTKHGAEKWFKIFFEDTSLGDYLLAEGQLSATEKVTQRIYLPWMGSGYAGRIYHIGFEFKSGKVSDRYYVANKGKAQRFVYDVATDTFSAYEAGNDKNSRRSNGVTSSIVFNEKRIIQEPMDFSGANGLYFWELFYYTPMLVVEKLLHAQQFEEAERWLKYVFNPAGYLRDETLVNRRTDPKWNARPLAEDLAWDNTLIDSTDPDVVAQGDPMHYKVATYMKLLDLLIARGDMAYRRLERDTLAEAKMWYVTALNLLGDEPKLAQGHEWSALDLATAASGTGQKSRIGESKVGKQARRQLDGALEGKDAALSVAMVPMASDNEAESPAHGEPMMRTGGGLPALRTANSLTAVFQPTENDKLKGYWQTLRQRLYNLRHNLSLDGQPLSLPLFATPADPKALQSAAATAAAGGGNSLPNVSIGIQRFPLMLESARNLVNQLIQFGGNLASVLERKDGEALNTLMQTQAKDLMQSSVQMQDKTIAQLQAEQNTLAASLAGATQRRDSYQRMLDEGVSRVEQKAIDQRIAAGAISTAANAMRAAGAGLDMAPNMFGLAMGGSRWGAVVTALGIAMEATSSSLITAADAQSMSEQYRRREQEWTIQRDAAEHERKQMLAQQASLAIQLEAAQLQKGYLETQQQQIQTQLEFLKTKFSNSALYSWMQGRLSAVFYQFYDLAIARCMKAQLGYQWETQDYSKTFIQPGAWDSNHAGLLCGEALMLNLAQMEAAYLEWDKRALEVSRTVSMAKEMGGGSFNARVKAALEGLKTAQGVEHTLTLSETGTGADKLNELVATINLNALNLAGDYPNKYGAVRRIKQVSVTLPALLGPYQDIQAVLSYRGQGGGIHQSCTQAAISHGVNDSGLFQLDFNDTRYLPFEGLPIGGDDNSSSLTLSFPNAKGKQEAILASLNDIVLHIRYTIR
ncbi:Tc toxin subunit A [Chromobacterium piscinae]|uniref:Tc toxin subunit A-related protein n=1 Tax=Chromobacterium piscinae TaxID=686831 RepID=UPI001E43BA07|nr:neuraminidase-like domain-containing protein [Chromobacterium piscinae]MCD4506930.1 Tc toxin subunit A [Chromobacterium piscinae]